MPPAYKPGLDQTSAVIKIHIDEVLLLATGLSMPVLMPKELFGALSMDALLTRDEDGSIVITGTSNRGGGGGGARAKQYDVLPAWDIFNPRRFQQMSAVEKRAVLRASGVIDLPRPREGEDALNEELLSVMDDSVRREYLRIGGDVTAGSIAPKSVAETEEQELLKEMGDALERGDMEQASALREKFTLKRSLKADPTQAKGSYDRFLDQDEWYMEARRRSMAPKKPA
jgi:hypothetical protein